MANTVMYTVAIATLSILLIGVLALDAEAKKGEVTIVLKGYEANFDLRDRDGNRINVIVDQLNDNKDVMVTYTIKKDGVKIAQGFDCVSPKQVLKISGMKKASIEFNTADLVCDDPFGENGVISANLIATEDKPTKEFLHDKTVCGETSCNRTHGYELSVGATAEATAFGISMDSGAREAGGFSEINKKRTTSPA